MTPAENKAREIFNRHYMVLFDSDSDKGEEIQVSLLAKKCAIVTVQEVLMSTPGMFPVLIGYYGSVLAELEKM